MLFSEIFPISRTNVHLNAYSVATSGNADIHTLAGKLSYKLGNRFQGYWVWVREDRRIVSENQIGTDEIRSLLKELWEDESNTFGDLLSVEPDLDWKTTPTSVANLTVRKMEINSRRDYEGFLTKFKQTIGAVRVERTVRLRPWIANDRPSVSISVSSNLVHNDDLKQFIQENGSDYLTGVFVKDKNSTLKGEVVEIVGTVAEHRVRLRGQASKEASQRAIDNASPDDLVVQVKTIKQMTYDYVVDSLDIVVRTSDFDRFKVNGSKVLNAMRLTPSDRWKMVSGIAQIAHEQGYIEAELTDSVPALFKTYSQFKKRRLLFGNRHSTDFNERRILSTIKQKGLYRYAPRFEQEHLLRVGIIRRSEMHQNTNLTNFLKAFQSDMQSVGFRLKSTIAEDLNELNREAFETAFHNVKDTQPDIILAILPDNVHLSDEEDPYNHLKSISVKYEIPSQVVSEGVLPEKPRKYAIGNIVLGVLAKTGNIPYILADPLNYADVIVGIDVARESKKRLAGTINAAATARIYMSNGEFLGYAIQDAFLEGETIDRRTIQNLLPQQEFAGKRVIIHRDGILRGNEERDLVDWGKRIGAKLYPVEVIKSGAPRLYRNSSSIVESPQKGDCLFLSGTEAILVSSLPPFKTGTPNPLQIRSKVLPIEQAVDSVLSLTMLHYGSIRAPRLPVTIHYSDKIAELILDGIKPDTLTGDIPYWL